MKVAYKSIASRFLIAFAIILIGIFGSVLSARATENENIIRVGYPVQQGLTEINEQGEYSGYSYEYLMEIAKYTGWEYEFVQVEGDLNQQLMTFLDMLKQGEIDLMGCMAYNQALSELYDFPGTNYGTSYYNLCSLSTNENINVSNYYLKDVLRVAVHSSQNQNNELLQQYADMTGFAVEQVFCSSGDEMYELLEASKVDAVLIKSISKERDNLLTLASFGPQPFYFATTKGNKSIVIQIDEAEAKIAEKTPYFALDLYDKYFANPRVAPDYSEEERSYMKTAGTIRALVLGGSPPMQYRDSNGDVCGVSVDVLNYISQDTGLVFETIMPESFAEYTQLIMENKVDIVLGVSDNLHRFDWQNMVTTETYMESPVMLVLGENTQIDSLEGRKLALRKDTHYDGTYVGDVTYYDTVAECLEAVRSGEADYTYGNNYTIQYYMNDPAFKKLPVVALEGLWIQDFRIGVVNPKDTVLSGVLDKSVRKLLQTSLLRNSLYAHVYKPEKVTLASYYRSNPVELSAILLLIISVVIIIFLAYTRMNEKRNAQNARMENERYEQISEISNEYLFEYNAVKDRLKLTEACAGYLGLPREIENASTSVEYDNHLIPQMLHRQNLIEEIQISTGPKGRRWVKIVTKWICDASGKGIYLIGKLTDIQEEIVKREQLEKKARTDSLTGVYNMGTFREQVIDAYENRQEKGYVFYIIDIDFFKQINDNYGHYMGDFVLNRIGQILLDIFKSEDCIVGRLGGDEFVAQTSYNGSKKSVEEVCELLKHQVAEITFRKLKDPITVSIGVGIVYSGQDFEEVYKKVDMALYEAKKKGRNGFWIQDIR